MTVGLPDLISQSNIFQASSDEESEDSELSNSDSDEESDDEEAEEAVVSKKRKADTEAVPPSKKSKTAETGETGGTGGQKNLFVGQLSWNVDEDWLTREFGLYGELASVKVITDKATGRSKGFVRS